MLNLCQCFQKITQTQSGKVRKICVKFEKKPWLNGLRDTIPDKQINLIPLPPTKTIFGGGYYEGPTPASLLP